MPNTAKDHVGTIHKSAGDSARIISLVPSITELLFELGLGSQIVGRTHYCCHPQDKIGHYPSVGGTKKVVLDRIKDLKPSHVIVNIDENTKEQVQAIADMGPAIVVTHPMVPRDNLVLYRLIGNIFDRSKEAEYLAQDLEAALEELRLAALRWKARDVLYLIWKTPWMTVSRDTYISGMLLTAGMHTLCHDPNKRYPEININTDLLAKADFVLFSSEPYSFTGPDVDELGSFCSPNDTKLLSIDGEMLSWYGSRAIKGLRYLKHFVDAMD